MTGTDTYEAYVARAERAATALTTAGFDARHADEGSSGFHNVYVYLDSGHMLVVYTDNPTEGYGWSAELFDQPGGTSLMDDQRPVELAGFDSIEGELAQRVQAALASEPMRKAFARTERTAGSSSTTANCPAGAWSCAPSWASDRPPTPYSTPTTPPGRRRGCASSRYQPGDPATRVCMPRSDPPANAQTVAERKSRMGSHAFSQLELGADARAAHRTAVQRAHHEHGHDSYNGTISTTSGVVMDTHTPMTLPEAQRRMDARLDHYEKGGPAGAIPILADAAVATREVKVTVTVPGSPDWHERREVVDRLVAEQVTRRDAERIIAWSEPPARHEPRQVRPTGGPEIRYRHRTAATTGKTQTRYFVLHDGRVVGDPTLPEWERGLPTQAAARAYADRCAHCGPINLLWDKRLAMLAAADHWLGHQVVGRR